MKEREVWKAGNMLYPCPVAIVSVGGKGFKDNIFTVAWCGTICTNPAMLYISVRPERASYKTIVETKEFVINLVSKDLVYAADFSGVRSGRDIDKFDHLHLTKRDMDGVMCKAIDESPVCIACKVKDIIHLGSHDMFIADVLNVSIEKKYLDDVNKFHLDWANLVCYSHGQYLLTNEVIGTFGFSVKKNK